jgi:hypothetical protein
MSDRNAFLDSYPYSHAEIYVNVIRRLATNVYTPTGFDPEYSYMMFTLQGRNDMTGSWLAAEIKYDFAKTKRC